MGLGGGGVLLIFLTVFAETKQLQAQGMNLLFFIVCAVVAIIIHMKNKLLDFKGLLWLAIPGFGGAILGTLIAGSIDTKILRILFACFLIVLGVREFFAKTVDEEKEY